MPAKNEDLHGNVPDKAEVALLLIDVINDLEFDDGKKLLKYALPMAEKIAALKKRAKAGRDPRHLRQRQLRQVAVRFQQASQTLPRNRRLRETHRRAALPAGGRLLRPEAEALRLLLHHARHAARLPQSQDVDSHGHRRQHLRALYSQRRLHARFQPRHPQRLRRLQHGGRERARLEADGAGAQGGHHPVNRA